MLRSIINWSSNVQLRKYVAISEPANHCSEKDEEVASFKAAGKALWSIYCSTNNNYCAESWHFCSNRLTGKLENLNERAIRFVYQDKISIYETLAVKNGYSALANQRLSKMLNTVFGAIGNGNAPTSISELLTARNSNYNLCGDAILKLPKVNSAK